MLSLAKQDESQSPASASVSLEPARAKSASLAQLKVDQEADSLRRHTGFGSPKETVTNGIRLKRWFQEPTRLDSSSSNQWSSDEAAGRSNASGHDAELHSVDSLACLPVDRQLISRWLEDGVGGEFASNSAESRRPSRRWGSFSFGLAESRAENITNDRRRSSESRLEAAECERELILRETVKQLRLDYSRLSLLLQKAPKQRVGKTRGGQDLANVRELVGRQVKLLDKHGSIERELRHNKQTDQASELSKLRQEQEEKIDQLSGDLASLDLARQSTKSECALNAMQCDRDKLLKEIGEKEEQIGRLNERAAKMSSACGLHQAGKLHELHQNNCHFPR